MNAKGSSSNLLIAHENGHASSRSKEQVGRKREWVPGLSKILLLFIVLGLGVLLGVMVSLHMLGYFEVNVVGSQCHNGFHNWIPSTPTQEWLTSLHHEMSDEELLWRASVTPQRAGLPIKRIPKIAFMFLTKGPLPFVKLWEKYFKGHTDLFSIYVHAPPGYQLEVPYSSNFYGRQIPGQEARWGEMSIIDAERRLLANALFDFSNERFLLVSESCIPVRNFTTFYNYVIGNKASFVGAFDDPGPFGRGRYSPEMGPEVKIEQWRKGAQWFEVSRKHAVFIVSDTKYYPKFRDFCKPNCYVDEHYISTMMFIEFEDELAMRSITSVDWSRGGAHPATFNKNDITLELIRRILDDRGCVLFEEPNQPCWFFARKFAPSALEPLLELSPELFSSD
ncbi:hypothetical protein R1flu_016955 [Riccia fluitans]|uniref:Core-2/I-branching beta-1,6-N-acetylglucosaminyltransferase family protein n=1 Tax=Riccia fluitans TaxID=41844 RepID=A0ABD1YNB1_9MARC